VPGKEGGYLVDNESTKMNQLIEFKEAKHVRLSTGYTWELKDPGKSLHLFRHLIGEPAAHARRWIQDKDIPELRIVASIHNVNLQFETDKEIQQHG